MNTNSSEKLIITRLKIRKITTCGKIPHPQGELNLIYYLSGEHCVTINGVTKKMDNDTMTATSISCSQEYVSNGEIILLECDNFFLLQFKTIYHKYAFNPFMRIKSANKIILRDLEILLDLSNEKSDLLSLHNYESITPLLALNAYLHGGESRKSDIALLQSSHINKILYTIKQAYGFHTKQPDILDEIREYIAKNYTSKLSRKDLAKKFGYNESYFSVFFKKNFGTSFTNYINSLRFNLVQQKLNTPNNETKTNIIFECGFNNPLSYYRYAKIMEKKQLN